MKTICIYHSIDLDGWMSAAIVRKWWYNDNISYLDTTSKTKDVFKLIYSESREASIKFLGWNYGDDIPNLEEYNKVIMCDVSFPKEVMQSIVQNKRKGSMIWIDHHISAINEMEKTSFYTAISLKGIRDTKFAACELTWKYFFPNEEMPEIVRLLGRYDCFDYRETKEELKVIEVQYGARMAISNYNKAYKYLIDDINSKGNVSTDLQVAGAAIYKYLKLEAKQIYKRGFLIKIGEEVTFVTGQHAFKQKPRFLCVNQARFNPINFGIDYHKEGYDGFACFHYDKGKWHFSLYNNNGNVDCSIIAKQYGGKGHERAAEFVVNSLKEIFK